MVHLTWAFVLCSSILCFVKSAEIADFERWAESKDGLTTIGKENLPSCFNGLSAACKKGGVVNIQQQFSNPCRVIYRGVKFDNAEASLYMDWQTKNFAVENRVYSSIKTKFVEGNEYKGHAAYFIEGTQNLKFLKKRQTTSNYNVKFKYIVQYDHGTPRLAYIEVAESTLADPEAIRMFSEHVKSRKLANQLKDQ